MAVGGNGTTGTVGGTTGIVVGMPGMAVGTVIAVGTAPGTTTVGVGATMVIHPTSPSAMLPKQAIERYLWTRIFSSFQKW